MSVKKVFNFYYDLCCQKLTVYSGTSSDEIKSTIREILEIPQDKQVRFLDEEGNPIVISSALPDQIKIYVEIKKTFTEKFLEEDKEKNENNPNLIKWAWNKGLEYENLIENKTVKHMGGGMGFAKGTLIMEQGEANIIILYYLKLYSVAFLAVYALLISKKMKMSIGLISGDYGRITPIHMKIFLDLLSKLDFM